MYNPFSEISVEIFGASHAPQIGVRIKGLPRGTAVDAARVQAFLDERKSGHNPWSTPRKEPDKVIFTEGLTDGKVDGDVVTAVINNTCQRSSDYDKYRFTPRPSHADYVATVKDGDKVELAGGGRFSGRMTAPMCIAGAIAMQILEKQGVKIEAYVSEIGGIKGRSYSDSPITPEEIENAKKNGLFALSKTEEMTQAVIEARRNGDSVGGAIECVVFGVPVGLGDALYGGTEGRIGVSLFAVPAVKSVEFGLGKGFAEKRGSEANDPFVFVNGKVATETNNNGGINGGITNGMPITLRVTIKPTPSISLPQKTVDLSTNEEIVVEIRGRHDACIVPRAVPAVKSAVALALLDEFIEEKIL